MYGHLLPARGGPSVPFTVNEAVKIARANAHRDASVDILRGAMSRLVKQAEGETANTLRGTLASFAGPRVALRESMETEGHETVPSTSPGSPEGSVPPATGLGTSWAPTSSDAVTEKTAFGGFGARRFLGHVGGKAKGVLQRNVARLRPAKPAMKPGSVKPKSLRRSLLPGALMAGTAYGLYKGVPAAANWAASNAARSPMAHNFGNRQYQYGYTPGGQAQF